MIKGADGIPRAWGKAPTAAGAREAAEAQWVDVVSTNERGETMTQLDRPGGHANPLAQIQRIEAMHRDTLLAILDDPDAYTDAVFNMLTRVDDNDALTEVSFTNGDAEVERMLAWFKANEPETLAAGLNDSGDEGHTWDDLRWTIAASIARSAS